MGPRPRGRGILTNERHRFLGLMCFNGATTSRSWNPRALRAQSARTLRFNGATTSRSWNPRTSGAPPPPRAGFNGATTSRSWNPDCRQVADRQRVASMGPRPRGRGIRSRADCPRRQGQASMGPRPRGRGIPPLGRRPCPVPYRFNGATTSRSWNPNEKLLLCGGRVMLQWGHDLAVVESPCARPARSTSTKLQWGHDLAVVESGFLEGDLAELYPLQWGHDLAVVESVLTSRDALGDLLASMGPRPRGRGISGRSGHGERRDHASMGPRPRGRGIAVFNEAARALGMLQWGHDLAVVESVKERKGGTREERFNGATTSRSWNPRGSEQERGAE